MLSKKLKLQGVNTLKNKSLFPKDLVELNSSFICCNSTIKLSTYLLHFYDIKTVKDIGN